MSLEPARDARRLKVGLLIASALCAGVLVLAVARASQPEYLRFQKQLAGRIPDPQGPIEVTGCDGEVDRCMSCHLAVERAGFEKEPLPLRTHSISLAAHPPKRFGCAICHGGEPRALDAKTAHGADPRMKGPHLEASCGACHVPQAGKGMDHLEQGARLFIELGCGTCHPLSGRGGWDFGSDLRAIGRKSPAYLEKVLLDPTSVLPGATMPSFQGTLAQDEQMLTDLVVFLGSLALPRSADCQMRTRSGGLVEQPCTRCHRQGVKEQDGAWHRCGYLKDRAGELRCGNCHSSESPIPATESDCPNVRSRRASCAVCHGRAGEGVR